MRRRDFLQSTAAGTAGTALLNASPTTQAAKSPAQPNLLIIHCDELNFRTLGCYRKTLSDEQAFMWGPKAVVETPHIDALAREGTLCTKFYAATPVCSPSRSSFLTGMYPQHTPVTTNNIPLSDDVVTFGEILSQNGYATGYAGKWHLDGEGKPQWEPDRKFGFQDNRYMFNRGHWKQLELTDNGPRVKARDRQGKPSYSVAGADSESFATDWLYDRCMEFITDHADEPFCYMLSIPDPHGPDTVREPYNSMYSDEDVQEPRTFGKSRENVPAWAMPAAKCNYRMATYHGMMKCIDDNVGRIVEHLKSHDLLDSTILIFTADHGDMRGEHGRQNKGIPLEASAKVPFIVRYPAAVASGNQVDHVHNTVDFLPSVLSLMGVSTAGREQGRDTSQFWTKKPTSDDWTDITFMRSTGKPGSKFGWISAVTPRYKLILAPQDPPWLLDLEEDPDELVNQIEKAEYRNVVRELATALMDYGDKLEDPYLRNDKLSGELQQLIG